MFKRQRLPASSYSYDMAAFLTTAIVYFLTFVVAYFGIKFIIGKKNETLKRPPCLPTLPVVGSLPYVPDLSKLHIFFNEKAKELGNVIGFYMCNRYVIVLNGKETIHEALVRQSLAFANRPQLYLVSFFEESYRGFVQHPFNEDFKKLHKLSLSILKKFGFGQGIMESRIRIEVENMLHRFSLKNGQAFDPSYETAASVSNVICSIIFGKRWDVDDPEFQEGMDIVHLQVTDIEKVAMINFFPVLRFLPVFRKAIKEQMKLRKRWRRYITAVLDGIIDVKEEDSFYKILKKELEAGADDLDKKEIAEHILVIVRDLFLAGTETTATTLQWFIVLMANFKDVQKQIRDEMDQVVGLNRHPSLEDKPNLPLLEATLLELMRFKTLVPLAVPHSTLKDTYINGMFIPANTVVFPNLYSCHVDPTVWKEPEKFDISRFLDETRTKVINRDQVISFSLGKRSCLGEILARQELFLFASALVHEFEIHPPIGQETIEVSEKIAVTNSPSTFQARFIRRRVI